MTSFTRPAAPAVGRSATMKGGAAAVCVSRSPHAILPIDGIEPVEQ
jgi:hypothetical protein